VACVLRRTARLIEIANMKQCQLPTAMERNLVPQVRQSPRVPANGWRIVGMFDGINDGSLARCVVRAVAEHTFESHNLQPTIQSQLTSRTLTRRGSMVDPTIVLECRFRHHSECIQSDDDRYKVGRTDVRTFGHL
jgi:hypothetical protein